ncbi:outer membrane protein assembly factor [Fibrisoma montanum]|uniref:Outer membrane protein assembly factor n=1 Tax=Fibrisoma montanum TaxID=2305895 RepID=A0A418M6A1_9BACT|nr:BamA/TamA family outer membrane protein [Fibrisoma montanum]RIV21447.1 outer membrane protein assembly factor [Fibrisoma montanum]
MNKMYALRSMMDDRLSNSSTSYSIRHTYKYLIWATCLLLTVSLSGCLTSTGGRREYLLTSQTVRGNRSVTREELESLIPQKPNRRILALPITPALWFYQLGSRRFNQAAAVKALQDKTNEFEQQSQQLAGQPAALRKLNRHYERRLKRLRRKAEEGNWIMRNLGEPPTYFYERDAQVNAGKMQKYLVGKGFFNAGTAYRLDTLRARQIRVNYLVNENPGFFLRNVTYEIADPRVDSLVRQSQKNSVVRVGDRFDLDNVSAEKVRIESLLRDQGYYAFSRAYIGWEVDSTRRLADDSLRRNLDLYMQITNPPGQSAHPVYYVGDVQFQITRDETGVPGSSVQLDTVRRNGITYLLGGSNISSRLLDSKIFMRPGQPYSQTKYRDTQRQLFLLNQFKFINLNITDSTRRQLRTLITAAPVDKYEYTFEGGLFVLYQGQGYPGPFANLSFRARNLFGGLETLETSVRYGFEAQTGFAIDSTTNRSRVYFAQEIGITSSFIFPQILFPGRMRFQFNPYNPRTQVSLGFTNSIRPDYRRSTLRSTMAYNWQTTPAKQFSFLIADVNLINANFNTQFGAAFEKQLDSLASLGSTIKQSFRRSISSSISFAYTYNTNTPGQNRRANFLRAVVESGGTTLNFFRESQLRQIFNLTDSTGLQYFKYLRLNVDFRHYIPLRPRTTLAFRFNTGLVYGYGSNRTAPYEKLFFAGGSNSIRAWPLRRLGPGAELPQARDGAQRVPVFDNRDGRDEQFAYTFEKPGDMLIEGSAELRGHLFRLLADINGAFFIDAGNVWTIRNNNRRFGEQFRFNTFVPQIAVGTGVGLRIDFSFFVIRFDGGIKVWDPARRYLANDNRLVDERFLLPKFSLRQLTKGPNPLVLNFGIGYPF